MEANLFQKELFGVYWIRIFKDSGDIHTINTHTPDRKQATKELNRVLYGSPHKSDEDLSMFD
jgi:hypothetical protein